MIRGRIKRLGIYHGPDWMGSYFPFERQETTAEISVIVDEISGDLRDGDEVFITKHDPARIQDPFKECCERAKEGDTNALGALPYLAERLIAQAR